MVFDISLRILAEGLMHFIAIVSHKVPFSIRGDSMVNAWNITAKLD